MAGRLPWLVALTLLRPATAAAASSPDLVFRVPDVQVRHASSQKSVGTRNISRGNDSGPYAAPMVPVTYEEYFIEHDISTVDARRAAQDLDLDKVPKTRPGCGACSRREMEYCETRLIADHCCCELRFFPEPFPWVPHTCYMGPNKCKPLAHDCARYARLRDCCCYRKVAEQWKNILANSSRDKVAGVSLLLLSMLLFVVYL